MKLKKKELFEIVDGNGELIGKDDIPKTGADLETQASHTTDYNAKVGTQPFRYDMLGRFGFTLMPFMEGKEEQADTFFHELVELTHKNLVNLTDYYIKHPNMLKPDNRKAKEENAERNSSLAKEIMELVEKYFGKESEKIDESSVVEDKVVNKKSEDEISKKSDDDDIKDKKLQKVAGLINKLDKKDIDKLINLLEIKK